MLPKAFLGCIVPTVVLATANIGSAQEALAQINRSAPQRFEQLDRNGDGRLSPDEVPRRGLFDPFDRDGDGFVTPNEISTTNARQARARMRAALEKAGVVTHYDIRYARTAGVEAGRQSLDVYTRKELDNAPVILFFHGGGWQRGDKLAAHQKPMGFVPEGCLFVSANYRFRPDAPMDEIMGDCAAAAKWISENAKRYGGDGDRVFLFGHSAGAHLAALLGTDHRYLEAAGLKPDVIRGVVPPDMGFYDVAAAAESAWSAERKEMISTVFGKDQGRWRHLSPINHVWPGARIPPFLVVIQDRRGDASRQAIPFVERLKQTGFDAELYEAKGRNHESLNRLLGTSDDPATGVILDFLRAHR